MPLSKTALITLSLTAGIATVASHPVAWSQQTPPAANTPATSTPTLKVTTQLTVVDVTVTDAKGKPVRGLTQSDFTLKEDGKPQPLRSFQQYGTDTPSTQPVPPTLPPNVYTNQQPPAPTTSAANILLVDALNTSPARRMYVRQQSLNYLKNMPAGTQVAIMELSTSLHVVQNFTTDRDVLLAAMDSVSPKKVLSSQVHSLNEFCQHMNTRSAITTDALNQLAAFASGIKGRKNLLWFMSGIPQITSYSYLIALKPPGSDPYIPCLADYEPQLHKAFSLLTAAQVAIYPVDPRGLLNSPSPSGDVDDFLDNVGQSGPSLPGTTPSMPLGQLTMDSMREIADATGGVAYLNRNDIDAAVGEAIATGTDYYSLSYTPPDIKYDGKHHTIDVKVDRPGLHLRYRTGYTSIDTAKLPAQTTKGKSAPTPQDAAFLTAMAHGAPDATQLLFIVRAQPATTPATPPAMGSLDDSIKNKHLVRYDLQYVLYPDVIIVADAGGAHKANVRFDAAAYDAEGKRLNVLTQTLNVALKPDEVARFTQTPFRFSQQLDLPPGKLFLRVGILDNTTEKIGTLEIPLTVSPK